MQDNSATNCRNGYMQDYPENSQNPPCEQDSAVLYTSYKTNIVVHIATFAVSYKTVLQIAYKVVFGYTNDCQISVGFWLFSGRSCV